MGWMIVQKVQLKVAQLFQTQSHCQQRWKQFEGRNNETWNFNSFCFCFCFGGGCTRCISRFPGQGSNWSSSCRPTPQPQQPATQDLSHIRDLHHSSWQHGILNPLCEVRNRTCILMVPNWVHQPLSREGSSLNGFLITISVFSIILFLPLSFLSGCWPYSSLL